MTMDPRLERVAQQMERTRWGAGLCDREWKLVWISDEMKVFLDEDDEDKLGYGRHMLECFAQDTWRGVITPESQARILLDEIPYMMPDTPGGKAGLVEVAGDVLGQLIEQLEPADPPVVRSSHIEYVQREGIPPTGVNFVSIRLHEDGEFIGTLFIYGSALPSSMLALLTRGDEGTIARMARLVEPGRRRAAILFADLEASGMLSRRLPSAAYFTVIRSLTTAIDDIIVTKKGVVGTHAGDGVTAFFVADELGSASGAARAAIEAAREIAVAAQRIGKEIGGESGLFDPASFVMNVGVHWGATLYMGQLVTGGRLEVTALGDEVNECARIQEAADNGQALASKSLVEHLVDGDAQAVGIDPDGVVYRPISEFPGVSEKALRDAGGIAVTVL